MTGPSSRIEELQMFYTDLTSRTTLSRLDCTSGARLGDLGKPRALHIVYCCFKREDLDLYNSSDGTTVTVSLCSVTCFSMTIAATKPVLISSNNLEGSKGWPSLSDL